ncbi:MAG: CorA family divalent cation transporter [Leptolyngbyaceae bacterium]|nr:CorA family divalent cation transporter [Leptolyngbyaceae bacterium]
MKLPQSWALPDTIKNRFGQKGAGKQRAMIADGHLLLVLHRRPLPGDRTRTGVFYWRKPNGDWLYSGGSGGISPLMKHVREYGDAEEKLTHAYEQANTADDYFDILEQLGPLRFASKNLHSTLQSAREGIPDDKDIIDLRDWAHDIERTLDLLYENTKNALDYKIAKRAEEQTQLSLASVEAGHRLNILAAIFFPLTAISCLFGMNVASGLENNSTTTFWVITLTSVVIGLWVRRWVLKGKW